MNERKIKMAELSILGAGTCNLACTYCFLCGLKEIDNFDKQLVSEIKNGGYLKKVLNIIKVTQNDPYNIQDMVFWGGESTLHLDLWLEHIEEWFNHFPNINRVSFVSNGTYNPTNLVKFMKIVNDFYGRKVEFHLQISIDGPDELNLETRGIRTSILQKKFIELQDLLAVTYLPNIVMTTSFKPTFPIDVYNAIHKDLASATEYWEFWFQFFKEVYPHCISKSNGYHCLNAPVITLPFDYTQQQGIDFAHSLRVQDSIDWLGLNNKYKNINIIPRRDTDLMSVFTEKWAFSIEQSPIGYCGQYLRDMLIRPDGKVVGCLAGLYEDMDSYREKAKEKDPDEYDNCTRIHPRYVFDPINMTKEEITEFMDFIEEMDQSYMFVTSAAALMYDLAVAGQIAPVYADNKELLMRHAHIVSQKTSCYYNSMRKTGSSYISILGLFRLYCNGALQYIDEKMRYGV